MSHGQCENLIPELGYGDEHGDALSNKFGDLFGRDECSDTRVVLKLPNVSLFTSILTLGNNIFSYGEGGGEEEHKWPIKKYYNGPGILRLRRYRVALDMHIIL
jgi:hypothetical protein